MDSGLLRRRIGERVRALRQERGISSQEALADQAGLHRTFVGRIERGESGVTVETVSVLAEAMGVSLAQFFEPWRDN